MGKAMAGLNRQPWQPGQKPNNMMSAVFGSKFAAPPVAPNPNVGMFGGLRNRQAMQPPQAMIAPGQQPPMQQQQAMQQPTMTAEIMRQALMRGGRYGGGI